MLLKISHCEGVTANALLYVQLSRSALIFHHYHCVRVYIFRAEYTKSSIHGHGRWWRGFGRRSSSRHLVTIYCHLFVAFTWFTLVLFLFCFVFVFEYLHCLFPFSSSTWANLFSSCLSFSFLFLFILFFFCFFFKEKSHENCELAKWSAKFKRKLKWQGQSSVLSSVLARSVSVAAFLSLCISPFT